MSAFSKAFARAKAQNLVRDASATARLKDIRVSEISLVDLAANLHDLVLQKRKIMRKASNEPTTQEQLDLVTETIDTITNNWNDLDGSETQGQLAAFCRAAAQVFTTAAERIDPSTDSGAQQGGDGGDGAPVPPVPPVPSAPSASTTKSGTVWPSDMGAEIERERQAGIVGKRSNALWPPDMGAEIEAERRAIRKAAPSPEKQRILSDIDTMQKRVTAHPEDLSSQVVLQRLRKKLADHEIRILKAR